MQDIYLLDCTLRDGGYVNDWNFGHNNMIGIFERLVQANVECIEVGFLDDRTSFDINRSIQPTTECFDRIYCGIDKKTSLVFGMIDYGTCNIDNISSCSESFLDGIRIIFKKPKMRGAVDFAKLVKEKGYKISLNLVSITSYSDKDLLELIDLINELNPDMISMVDTYGLMQQEDMLHYYHLLNHNLNTNIILGYHSHNNFQLGYSNEISMIKKAFSRNVIVDGTVYGMGKSAGNAPLELLAMHLNENYNKKYDLNQILELIDISIMRIYKEHYWGYSLLYFLAASNDCHPNYIQYLLNKKTLSVGTVNDIVKRIESDKKLNYDEQYIDNLYYDYQAHVELSPLDEAELQNIISEANILLLGPGSSLKVESTKVRDYIDLYNPIVISVNCVPDEYHIDFIFVGNSKRYDMLYGLTKRLKYDCKIIATSNIAPIEEKFDYVFQYEKLRSKNASISDNSFIMALNLLVQFGIPNVAVAGFDGFSSKANDNYYEGYLVFDAEYSRLEEVNINVKKEIFEIKKNLSIKFITRSLYE